MTLSSYSVYVEKIEKRVASGIWVTAQRGANGPMVLFETTQEACPIIGAKLVVTIDSSET